MNIIAIIPARLASKRLSEKLMIKFNGIEMIEHVRRRVVLSNVFNEVYVATGDDEIEELIRSNNGNIIKTYKNHKNGTSRASEAIQNLKASHIVLIQGDEPLILPEHLQKVVKSIKKMPKIEVWNATTKFTSTRILHDDSQVKCSINEEGRILYCFRRSPSISSKDNQLKYIRKMLGIMAYKKEILLNYPNLQDSLIEQIESIEQIRLISNNVSINSIEIDHCFPSVNISNDIDLVENYIRSDPKQQEIIKIIINNDF